MASKWQYWGIESRRRYILREGDAGKATEIFINEDGTIKTKSESGNSETAYASRGHQTGRLGILYQFTKQLNR